MMKYNIYIICKDEDFLKRKKIFDKHKSKICHIQWVPAIFNFNSVQ